MRIVFIHKSGKLEHCRTFRMVKVTKRDSDLIVSCIGSTFTGTWISLLQTQLRSAGS
jgi:hypothetical protein